MHASFLLHSAVTITLPQEQGRTGRPGNLALVRWAGWSAGQEGV